MKKKVLLGMSGGVDSSVSAILLQEAGYEVIGATMKLWEQEDKENQCYISDTIEDAKKVCNKLGILHYTLDFKKEFKCLVINNFIEEYKNARTPNPCIECNKYLKFKFFLEKAQELGCNYIATGHYARREYSTKYNQYVLKKSEEEKKDQTYFLYSIPKHEIEKIIFPLQDIKSKEQTRRIAEEYGLQISKKKDSQEICFIPNGDYAKFVRRNIKIDLRPGKIKLKTGEVLGTHDGLINYTIGQRKGLGISYKEPLYVIKLDNKKNEVIVGVEKDLYIDKLYATDLNWTIFNEKDIESNRNICKEIKCKAKVRYRAKEAEATIYFEDKKGNYYKDEVIVIFKEPQRAVTPGQSIVFYDEEGIVLRWRKNKMRH